MERLAVSHAPKAVLHNLKFAKLFAEEFSKNHGKYVRYNFSLEIFFKNYNSNIFK